MDVHTNCQFNYVAASEYALSSEYNGCINPFRGRGQFANKWGSVQCRVFLAKSGAAIVLPDPYISPSVVDFV
jgi:hypothetical protein